MGQNTRVAVTRDNAVLLLAAAEELGLEPGVVLTYDSGFGAPDEVLEKAGFDVDSGLPKSKDAKDAADPDFEDPNTVGSGNPVYRDHDITLSDEELKARQEAADATSQEGAVTDDELKGETPDVGTRTAAQENGEPPTTRSPEPAKKATAKKATAKSTRS